MNEGARIQNLKINEGGRVQGLEMQGRQFAFQTQENREGAQLDRVSTQLSGAQAREGQAQADRTSALTGAIGGIGSAIGAGITANVASKTLPFPPSDRRLKKNIKLIGYSPKGLKIICF